MLGLLPKIPKINLFSYAYAFVFAYSLKPATISPSLTHRLKPAISSITPSLAPNITAHGGRGVANSISSKTATIPINWKKRNWRNWKS
jgi:hypothetical protein